MARKKFKPGDRLAVLVEIVECSDSECHAVRATEIGSFTLPGSQLCPGEGELVVIEYVGKCWDTSCTGEDGWRIVEDE